MNLRDAYKRSLNWWRILSPVDQRICFQLRGGGM